MAEFEPIRIVGIIDSEISVANYPPLGMIGTVVDFEIVGQPARADQPLIARFRIIDSEFFRTMRLPLVKGRAFETGDADEAHGVVIVSETGYPS